MNNGKVIPLPDSMPVSVEVELVKGFSQVVGQSVSAATGKGRDCTAASESKRHLSIKGLILKERERELKMV